MIPNELRYENWVKYNNEYWQINAVDGSSDEVDLYNYDHASDVDIDEIEPIPIDRIMLAKLGFTKVPKSHRSDYDWIYEYKKAKSIIELSIGGYKKELHLFLWSGDCLKHIKNVHELQNLYFALTGEEMDIQLSEAKSIKNV